MILALESSTASAKALLYNPKTGITEHVAAQAYGEDAWPARGIHDPQAVAGCTFALGRRVCEGFRKVEAIAVCGTYHSVVLCERPRPGTPGGLRAITPVYTWMSPIAETLAAARRSDAGYTRQYYQRTGCMVNALYPAFQLMALRDAGVGFENTRIASESGFVFSQLTGQAVETGCTNSGGGLINLQSRDWDPQTIDEIGLKEENLSPLAMYRDARPLSSAGAALLGLPSGIPVLPSYPDGALNQVGSGALGNGAMTFSMGTSGALRLSVSAPLVPETPGTWCYLSPSAWLSGAAVNGACNCVDWVKAMLFPAASYSEIEREKPKFQNMPYFLPFIFGERCPGWNDAKKGGFYELRSHHTPQDIYYSVLEGVLFNVYQCYELLCKTAGKPEQIQLSGGILNSAHWKEMCADIFGRSLHCAKIPQASLAGGVVLAMEVTGFLSSIEDHKVEIDEILQPDMNRHRIFMKRYAKYLEYYWGM
ncbi:MAG: FGGY-family carbohydrate kinase [Spirochaetaceae bacterium]|nr:FGGY-family carbohydrate kinase [Spirochaetaceae bacterium]